MNSDGSDQHALTDTEAQWVTWLPDGQHLGYTSLQGGNAIFQIAIDGSGIKKIPTSGSPITPTWSPDGKLIAFTMFRLDTNDYRLYLMNADGTNEHVLTDKADVNPMWSPDGQSIAFSWMWMNDNQKGGSYAVCIIGVDGTNRHCLTDPKGNNAGPSWSPDGKHILFNAVRDGKSNIYVMNPDGTGEQRLTSEGNNELPAWSADGKSIVFVSERDGNPEIYVMDTDGKNAHRLTDNPEPDVYPAWQPLASAQMNATTNP